MTKEEYISEISKYVEGSYTALGFQKWWDRPRRISFNGKTPNELLNQEPFNEEDAKIVLDFARRELGS